MRRLQEAELWQMDGTFDRCPDQFQQLYTVFGTVRGGESIALVHAVMTKATIQAYESLMTNILLSCAEYGDIQVKRIVTDFETAVVSAVRRLLRDKFTYLNVQLSGCLFHWADCLRRNSKLLEARKNVQEIDEWYQAIRGLPLLPVPLVKRAWNGYLKKVSFLHYKTHFIT